MYSLGLLQPTDTEGGVTLSDTQNQEGGIPNMHATKLYMYMNCMLW